MTSDKIAQFKPWILSNYVAFKLSFDFDDFESLLQNSGLILTDLKLINFRIGDGKS